MIYELRVLDNETGKVYLQARYSRNRCISGKVDNLIAPFINHDLTTTKSYDELAEILTTQNWGPGGKFSFVLVEGYRKPHRGWRIYWRQAIDLSLSEIQRLTRRTARGVIANAIPVWWRKDRAKLRIKYPGPINYPKRKALFLRSAIGERIDHGYVEF